MKVKTISATVEVNSNPRKSKRALVSFLKRVNFRILVLSSANRRLNFLKARGQGLKKLFRVPRMAKCRNEVVSVPAQIGFAFTSGLYPLFKPQVERIVMVYVRQNRTDNTAITGFHATLGMGG
jgi:hypothetical protein